MKRRFLSISVIVLLLLSAMPLIAQEQTSSIEGTVTDASGAALPGVSIEAVNARGQRFSAQTDGSGKYRFPSIPPGNYTVTGTLAGLDPASVRNVNAALGATPKADLTLRIGAVSEQITVTAEAPLVDPTSSATTTSITSDTFDKLPKGRDFSTVITQAASANFETKQGAAGSGGISIDGASGSENVYVVDGVNTTNPQTGTQGKIVITDFIEEVQVKSAGYQAEFGGAVGGVINVVTKTGTNDFRGTVGAQMVDSSWGGDRRPVLETDPANAQSFRYAQYGNDDETVVDPTFALGGPVLRDHLWFFAAYAPSMRETDRTVNFTNGTTDTFSQEFTRQNWAATLNGSLGSKFLFKFSGNNSGYEQTNLLPGIDGRGSSARTAYDGQLLERENWSYSGYGDFIATPEWYFSARGGRYYDNLSQGGIPTDPFVWFAGGSPSLYPGVDPGLIQSAGFRSPVSANSAITEDSYQRDNFDADVSWFPTFAGTHRFKAGVQLTNLKNNVDSGNQNYLIRAYWDKADPFAGTNVGTFGNAGVYVFKTFGKVESENTGLFLQDSWTTMNDRLTLNMGVRTEQEKVPSYADPSLGLREYAIEFDYQDKLAPRFGFAYDLFGTGRSKVFGSYGKYYDITKMEMPRGSFGGDKWIWFDFKIEDPNWKNWQCQNVGTSQGTIPTCTGGLVYNTSVDLRHPSLDLIEPDLKPMESREFTLGGQHELTNQFALGVRYVNKQLVRTIEDVGVLVTDASGAAHEEYFIANPGFGVAATILAPTCPTCPALPKAKRDYQAFELEATKRFGNSWGAHASYVYSELEGNYGGLASSDENGRNSPNVNRYFDNLFNSFDSNGDAVYGKLATDRPHVFKAQVIYSAPWGTGIGVNQYIGSGTPIQTEFTYAGVPFFANGRGDMGRTPTLKRTDLQINHEFRLSGRYGFEVGVNVLNVFDHDTAVNINNSYSTRNIATANGSVPGITDASFFNGFDPYALIPAASRNPLYGQANQFQDPREVRLFAKFRF